MCAFGAALAADPANSDSLQQLPVIAAGLCVAAGSCAAAGLFVQAVVA